MSETTQIVAVVFFGITSVAFLFTRAIIRFNDQVNALKREQQHLEYQQATERLEMQGKGR